MTDQPPTKTSNRFKGSCLSKALQEPGNLRARACDPEVDRLVIGMLPGEGVGPELVDVAKSLLEVVAQRWPLNLDIRMGGAIGLEAEKKCGKSLSPEVSQFCESVFKDKGVLLCGAGGGRFVYDLRKKFDLFCKLTPVKPTEVLKDTGVLKPTAVEGVDMVVVRENVGGLYFGKGSQSHDSVTHTFQYFRRTVERIIEVAVRLAQQRSGRLTLVVKMSALVEMSQLWAEVFNELTSGTGLETTILEVDNAAYQIIAAAQSFDVLVTPNMFGDIISDVSALLLGSRGMSFSGNYTESCDAVYQTAHGAAYDLAGTDIANPIGQILTTSMLLRESFGLYEPAAAIEQAVERTLMAGLRTADISTGKARIVGTREMGQHIKSELEDVLALRQPASC